MKICIISHARWGKDTLGEFLLETHGIKFASSSQTANDLFIFDTLKDQYGYSTVEECFEDRINHRDEWYQMICDFNRDDRTKLARCILDRADAYVGMRDLQEMESAVAEKLFDHIIWVDASKRLPPEPIESFNIPQSFADITIDNNGTLEEFKLKAWELGEFLTKKDVH